jgi:hypothetical protein
MRAPHVAWYLVPVAIAIAGLILAGALTFHGVAAWARVPMPGAEILVMPAGPAVMHYETRSGAAQASVRCILRAPDGSPVSLQPATGTWSYTVNGVSGRPMFEVDAPIDGEYQLVCETDGADFALAFGRPVLTPLLGILPWLIALGAAAVASALTLVILRRRPRRTAGDVRLGRQGTSR